MTPTAPQLRSINRLFAVACVATAAIAPAAAQAKPAGEPVQPAAKSPVQTDVRTPDARDAAQPQTQPRYAYRDLRPIDPSVSSAPKPAAPVSTHVTASDDGFDWPSAGIGAGAAFGLGLLTLSGFALTVRRRPGRSALLS